MPARELSRVYSDDCGGWQRVDRPRAECARITRDSNELGTNAIRIEANENDANPPSLSITGESKLGSIDTRMSRPPSKRARKNRRW